jgi:hypothetical protein
MLKIFHTDLQQLALIHAPGLQKKMFPLLGGGAKHPSSLPKMEGEGQTKNHGNGPK